VEAAAVEAAVVEAAAVEATVWWKLQCGGIGSGGSGSGGSVHPHCSIDRQLTHPELDASTETVAQLCTLLKHLRAGGGG
jgi:hypothetical protein